MKRCNWCNGRGYHEPKCPENGPIQYAAFSEQMPNGEVLLYPPYEFLGRARRGRPVE